MDQITQFNRIVRCIELKLVTLLGDNSVQITIMQSVNFLGPDAKCLTQWAWESTQETQIVFVYNTRPVSGYKRTALFYKLLNAFANTFTHQIEHWSNQQLVLG
ncbi:hypothetical protein D3C74_366000 [compost metagenome]